MNSCPSWLDFQTSSHDGLFLELGPWHLGVLAVDGLLKSCFVLFCFKKSEAIVFGCSYAQENA